jgi:hypothetical protein
MTRLTSDHHRSIHANLLAGPVTRCSRSTRSTRRAAVRCRAFWAGSRHVRPHVSSRAGRAAPRDRSCMARTSQGLARRRDVGSASRSSQIEHAAGRAGARRRRTLPHLHRALSASSARAQRVHSACIAGLRLALHSARDSSRGACAAAPRTVRGAAGEDGSRLGARVRRAAPRQGQAARCSRPAGRPPRRQHPFLCDCVARCSALEIVFRTGGPIPSFFLY